MWLAPLAQLLALSAMAPPPAAASSAYAQASPQPIATRQTLFAIPFRVDPADRPSREPAEVQLYVSGDRGATWQLYWKSVPQERRFMFRAGADGEFWFLVRTLDRSGRLWPQRPNAPELKVVVDTMPPKLQLRAERGQAGQITAHWQIDDPQADPDSLTIQYRTMSDGPMSDGPWQEVALDRQTSPASTSPQTGQVTWWPHATSGEIQVRTEVSDTAGNLAVNHAQIKVGQDTGAAALTAQASSSQWRASSETNATAWPAEPYAGGAGDYAARADGQGNSANYQGYATDHQSNATLTGAADASEPKYPSTGADTPFSLGNRDQLNPPTGTLTSTVNPPIQNQYVAAGDSQGGAFESGLPPGQRPQMVDSPTFQLEYDVTSVGSSGISRVELWGTEDGGRSWRLLALDDDNRSPLTVKVDREGIYGLKVVVTSGTGLGGGRPQPGELPEIVVGVDLTKPTAEITAARQGVDGGPGNLTISWQAHDQQLAARPISLLLSERAGGPWTTLAGGLPNSGSHRWTIDHRAPPRIYLRLEVKDEAGNVGTFETTEPVSLDRFRPAAQIRGVRPMEKSDAVPARQYYLP